MAPGHHALVFGASGISGWAITNSILAGYPSKGTFSRVTAITNRPLDESISQWPESQSNDDGSLPTLCKVSGIDLLESASEVKTALAARIPLVETVSHVFYFAYRMLPDTADEIAANVKMLENAVGAIDQLAGQNLRFVVLPTGTKRYGVHLLKNFSFSPPLAESLPRTPEPYRSQNFYYAQIDALSALATPSGSSPRSWTWCEVIPDVIVGFVPQNNFYCLAQVLATYLSLYREINGKGASVQFPGTSASWTSLSNDSSQDTIARFSIYAALNPSKAGGGKGWNVADSAEPRTWSDKWPVICRYFGLVGTPPPVGSGDGRPGPIGSPQPAAFIGDNHKAWLGLEAKHGLQSGRAGNDRAFGGFANFIMVDSDFDRQLDMSALHAVWDQADQLSIEQGWYTAFDRFQQARIIPPVDGIPLGTWKTTGHLDS